MSLSIRQWLIERKIELEQLQTLGAEVSGVAFRLAQDMEVKSLTPFDVCSLADVLESPLVASRQVAKPIAQLTTALLRLLSRKKPLKRAEGTWLTFQIAYLKALETVLDQELELRRPWINRAMVPVGEMVQEGIVDARLHGFLRTLRPGKLSDSQAEQALTLVGESLLVQQMNNLALAWLVANGAEETEAGLLIQRLVNGLPGHLLEVIVDNALPLAQLQKFVRLGGLTARSTTLTEGTSGTVTEIENDYVIDLGREHYRAQLLKTLGEPIFGETFSLQDIYVPPRGVPISDANIRPMPNHESNPHPPMNTSAEQSVDLATWAAGQLDDWTSISVIEGEAGFGKTSFCQMWAAQIARRVYPTWMPIWIRLRDAHLGQNLEETLDSAFPLGRFSDADGWLSHNAPPSLLILDGLDELPRSPYKLRHIRAFLDQVMQFHAQQLSRKKAHRHKIVLTCRQGMFEGVIRTYRVGSIFPLQTQMKQIRLQPMDQDSLRQWFKQWGKLQSKNISYRYFTFLKEEGLFTRKRHLPVADLVHQPLMLYLLGILHRDGLVDRGLFQLESPQARYEIYERMTRWLLGEHQGYSHLPEMVKEGMAHASRSTEAIANLLAGQAPQEPRRFMQEIALRVFQTGSWVLKTPPWEALSRTERGTNPPQPTPPPENSPASEPTPELLNPWQQHFNRQIRTAALFFSVPSPVLCSSLSTLQVAQKNGLEQLTFSHPNLGSYLAATEISKQLQLLTQQVHDRYGDMSFRVASDWAVAQHLYSFLGYGFLSLEMEEFLMENLQQAEERNPHQFSFPLLFKRLYKFYRSYCQGRWFDEGLTHQAHAQLQQLKNPLNALQVDGAVGLNVFLLLCGISQRANIPFYPCGDPNQPQDFDADRFLILMSRTTVLSPTSFFVRARHSLHHLQLPGACLSRAMLTNANLEGTNLAIAELSRANLVGANLTGVNLSWATLASANLVNSNLNQANLEGADLSRANLVGVNLSSANLHNACLFEAKLDPDNEQKARSSGAFFTWEEFQDYSQSLAPKMQLGDLVDSDFFDGEIQIEIAEGEPFMPDAWYTSQDVYSPDLEVYAPAASSDNETIAAPPSNDATLPAPLGRPPISSDDETWAASMNDMDDQDYDATLADVD
ncbi:pentapeptide repeat-containing protein [Spirulina subsalsa]|uniref:pentapeptide repeat-containing protein n=1 Tax=Spirulina subsalsa TaxID=54311 RepID=UPI0002F27EBE|nr:pentapeptide repeat-containing protein [Spirulina subsalsa]